MSAEISFLGTPDSSKNQQNSIMGRPDQYPPFRGPLMAPPPSDQPATTFDLLGGPDRGNFDTMAPTPVRKLDLSNLPLMQEAAARTRNARGLVNSFSAAAREALGEKAPKDTIYGDVEVLWKAHIASQDPGAMESFVGQYGDRSQEYLDRVQGIDIQAREAEIHEQSKEWGLEEVVGNIRGGREFSTGLPKGSTRDLFLEQAGLKPETGGERFIRGAKTVGRNVGLIAAIDGPSTIISAEGGLGIPHTNSLIINSLLGIGWAGTYVPYVLWSLKRNMNAELKDLIQTGTGLNIWPKFAFHKAERNGASDSVRDKKTKRAYGRQAALYELYYATLGGGIGAVTHDPGSFFVTEGIANLTAAGLTEAQTQLSNLTRPRRLENQYRKLEASIIPAGSVEIFNGNNN